MSLAQELREIGSYEFAVKLNVVSSMRSFFAAAGEEAAVSALCKEMLESGEAREEVIGRIYDLCSLEIDRRYENPNDTALAIMLWLTIFAAPDYSQMAANLVDSAPQCWYAKKLARRILVPPPVSTGNSWVGSAMYGIGSTGSRSGDMLITMKPMAKEAKRFYEKAIAIAYTGGDLVIASPSMPIAASTSSGDLFMAPPRK